MRAAVLLVGLALLAGCGGAQTRADRPPLPIDAIRERARANPRDAAAQRALAVGELLEDGGEAARARAAIDGALALDAADPALHLLSAIEHEQRGRMPEYFDALVGAVDAARTSDAPYAPYVGEMAIGYAGSLETDVPDWRARFRELLTRTLAEPGALGLPAVAKAAGRLRALRLRDGEVAQADELLAGSGCVDEVRAAGPFGPLPMLRFESAVPAEGEGPLAERYDVGEPIGDTETRTLEAERCGFSLGGPRRGPGVWVVERRWTVTEAGRYALAVRTPNAFRVRLDGEIIGGIDRRAVRGPSVLYLPVDLSAGEHELEVVLASRHGDPYVSLRLAREADGWRATNGLALPTEPSDHFERMLFTTLARGRGDHLLARELTREADGPHAPAARLILLADVTLRDPHRPSDQRTDTARELLERAAENDPEAWYPAYRAALTTQGARETLAAFREVVSRFGLPSLHLGLARRLRERGDLADADAEVARARALVPSCDALGAEIEALDARGRVADVDAHVDDEIACDARSTARLDRLRRQRRWEDARTELDRLAPMLPDENVRGLRAGLARAVADTDALDVIRAEIAQENERSVEDQFPALHVDRLLASGERSRALAAIEAGQERDPERWGGLRRVRRALGGDDPLLRYRLDGAEAIREFEASGRSYDGATQVLVLDYMVIRVLENGSSESLVHQIYRVQSEEAIERLGQLSLPGYVLTVRSIKPDGRRLEPDQIAGLDHIELPDLQIGDYVEYEFIRGTGRTLFGGYRSSGWVFQNFSEPFDISQIVLVAPNDMDVHVETRGPVPEPEVRRDGDLRVSSWTVRESRPLTGEPDAATSPERLPGIEFGVGMSWDRWFDIAVDAFMDRAPRDPAVERLVARVLGNERDEDARIRRLHRWVVENIEAANTESVVPMQIAARRGDQAEVLHHLLEVAGLEARVVLVRELGGRAPMELSRADVYTSALVMVRRREGEPYFLPIGERHLATGYIPIALRGQQGVVLEPGHPIVTVPAQDSSDLVDVTVEMEMTAQGGARVNVEERHRGASAYMWRSQLSEVPAAELERVFEEAYVGRMFPQSSMTTMALEGMDAPGEPFVMRYAVEAPVVGRGVNGGVLVAPLFAIDAARALAALPSRETSERVFGFDRRVTVRVRGVDGVAPRTLEDVSVDGPEGASVSLSSTTEGGVLEVQRRLRIGPRLVTPEQYEEFARFCRVASEVEMAEIAVPMR